MDLAFAYLRRLADRFAFAFCFIAFKHFNGAPKDFRSLRSVLTQYDPDVHPLRSAFASKAGALTHVLSTHSRWFEFLADPVPWGNIRNRIEHRVVQVEVTGTQPFDDPRRLTVHLLDKDGEREINLREALEAILPQVCVFWTEVYRACGSGNDYIAMDDLAFYSDMGDLHDEVYFWPELS